jgi:hypothetical protein
MPIKNDQWLDQIVSAGRAQPLFREWPQAYREFQGRCPKKQHPLPKNTTEANEGTVSFALRGS